MPEAVGGEPNGSESPPTFARVEVTTRALRRQPQH
ncbi:MAG: hypothetical protein QOH58_398 [Thermoleophilaceae bacterium]|jgi:hypothetical protein|nr:hypothetical protein [Thermoleophilaceae bacterium]